MGCLPICGLLEGLLIMDQKFKERFIERRNRGCFLLQLQKEPNERWLFDKPNFVFSENEKANIMGKDSSNSHFPLENYLNYLEISSTRVKFNQPHLGMTGILQLHSAERLDFREKDLSRRCALMVL
ncbi:hypothetical protein NPIL_113561 [Nephila pilipes]|uniref:Uncharacterized protein n=1 Tax=Nephila pilipes TaxID=299642 RepID=A0A8X6UHK7_NEPPI|nr:hypothetical protein NPIL_113561 [Nephila pilipes]